VQSIGSQVDSEPRKAEYFDHRPENFLSVFEEANRIASMTSLEDLLEQMLDLMIRISGATNGTLYLRDAEARQLIFMVVRGDVEDRQLIGQRMQEDKGIVGAALQSKAPIVIEDLSCDPRWYREIRPELTARLHNAITLPLLLNGVPIGAVQIFNYTRAEVELLQLLGSRMASEVDKVLLLERSRRTNQRLQELVDVMGRIGAILDRDQLLAKLTEDATQLLGAESSSVFLVDSTNENGAVLLSRSSKGNPIETEQLPLSTAAQKNNIRFLADSAISVPLRARPITVGKERRSPEARTVGNLMTLNKQSGSFNAEDGQLLEILASQASTVLQITTLYNQANELFLDFIKALASAIDAKDPYTRGHSQRVSDYAVAIASELGLEGDALMDIRVGSLLHDIGKIGVPDHILAKPGTLSDDEYEQIKKHPGIGYKIIEQVHLLHNILPAIVEHHERLDGSGYPFGLHGDQMSKMGRIVAVADVYDALTTDRPYRKAMGLNAVIEFMKQNSGDRFDAECVEALTVIAARKNDPLLTE
jgi:putative nucleotidyltransferase with HDIG domain